jgi:hypothetical protein
VRIRFRVFFLFLAAIPLTGFGQTNSQTFSFGDKGAASIITDGNGSLTVGYGRVLPDGGQTAPSGVAIFGERIGGTLVSEAGVPASPLIQNGRIYAEVGPNGSTGAGTDIGLAIANPGPTPATISFTYTRSDGTDIGGGSTTLGAGSQKAVYLDQAPWNLPLNFQGTFTFTSNAPISVVALQLFNNQRGEPLITTLPVIDTNAGATSTPALLSHFVDGLGWSTTVILVNQTETPQAGTIAFHDDFGNIVTLTANSTTAASFAYSIPKHSSFKLQTAGGANEQFGSVTVTPNASNNTPVSLSVFSYKNGAAVTQTQAGVPSNSGTFFRTYVESTANPNTIGSYDTGIAVANGSTSTGSVTFDLYTATGASTGLTTTIPLTALGHKAEFINELFPTLTLPFQGVLRISTSLPAISVVALRIRYNERNEFLMTTTPPSDESAGAGTTEVDFPQIANGAGWTTQFNLFSGVQNQATSGKLMFVQPDSTPFNIKTINLIAGPPVTLTSIAPSSVAPGGTVVLTGTNMSSSNVVFFTTSLGALGVTPSAATSTSLTAAVPPNAITGPVFVLNGSQVSASVILQVTASNGSPQITTFDVSAGANTAGTDIYVPPPAGALTITGIGFFVNGTGVPFTASATLSKGTNPTLGFAGSGFTPASTVTVGAGSGITLSNVNVVSSSTITATVSVSATAVSGPRSITVLNPNGDVAIFTGGLIIQ